MVAMSLESPNLLEHRAHIKKKIRAYLDDRGLLEADVPAVYPFVCPDDAIDLMTFDRYGRPFYLQPSPELNLKKVLSFYHHDCYSLNYAYRSDPRTPRHHPEFMMLELYLLGENSYRRCIQMTVDVIAFFTGTASFSESTYEEIWARILGRDYQRSDAHFKQILNQLGTDYDPNWDLSVLEDLIFSLHIQPFLGMNTIDVISGFPAHQAALAKIDPSSGLAHRYEVFVAGVEVANGYYELSDEQENRERFEQWISRRVGNTGMQTASFRDEQFFKALAHMPLCSGVAIGIDRLFMRSFNAQHIEDVLLVPWSQYCS